jgi:uncharacterized protein YigE (DUF2233 family)
MLAVDSSGNVTLRSLHDNPYASSENLQQATQSAPMLLLNGARTTFTANSNASPRSIVAIDKSGYLLFIVSPSLAFTLDQMADLLAASDLSLTNALNLDGGSSTGLYVTSTTQPITLDSYVNLPIMIVAKER